MVADALSRKDQPQLATFLTQDESLIREFNKMKFEVVNAPEIVDERIATLLIEPDLRTRIMEAQRSDAALKNIQSESKIKKAWKISRGDG